MTITRDVREKVIQEGYGRNKIARILNGQNLHISEGSVGIIIRAYRKQSPQLSHDQYTGSLQKKSSCIDTVMTPQSSQPEAHSINSTTPINIVGSSSLHGDELASDSFIR